MIDERRREEGRGREEKRDVNQRDEWSKDKDEEDENENEKEDNDNDNNSHS
jgi:hypothetical protein